MEKTDPNAENVARSATDKTVIMAEEKLGVSVAYITYTAEDSFRQAQLTLVKNILVNKQAIGHNLLRNRHQLSINHISFQHHIPSANCCALALNFCRR